MFLILDNALTEWTSAFIGTTVKLIIWTIPAIFFVRYYQNDIWITLNEMITSKIKWQKCILIVTVFLLYYFVAAYVSYGKIDINRDFIAVDLVGKVFFAGITEENAFRAWLLNAMLKKLKIWYAILLNAVLFLLIRFRRIKFFTHRLPKHLLYIKNELPHE